MPMQKNIFEFADKFGYESPFSDWVTEEREKRENKDLLKDNPPQNPKGIHINKENKVTKEFLDKFKEVENAFNNAIAHLKTVVNDFKESDKRLISMKKNGLFKDKQSILDLFDKKAIVIHFRNLINLNGEVFSGSIAKTLYNYETNDYIDGNLILKSGECRIEIDKAFVLLIAHIFSDSPDSIPLFYKHKSIEGIKEEDKQSAWVFFESTLLHEMVHIGYHIAKGEDKDKVEEGEVFESEAYLGGTESEIGLFSQTVGGRLTFMYMLEKTYHLGGNVYSSNIINPFKGKNMTTTANNPKLPTLNVPKKL